MKKTTLIKIAGITASLMLIVPMAFAQTTVVPLTPSPTTPPTSPVPTPLTPSMIVRIEQSGRAQLGGTLAAISGTTLTVTSWGGNWTVDASNAKLVRRFGDASNISEFQVGDILQIQGAASPNAAWTIIATIVKDNSIQVRNVNSSGVISNLNAPGKSFTLTAQNGQVWQVTLQATGQVYVNGQIGSFSDLTNGITVRVQGVLDRTQKTILAVRIAYYRQTANVYGTISNLNASNSSFTLTAPQNTLQVTLQANAKIIINDNPGAFSDLKNGITVRVHGLVDKNLLTMSADSVQYRQQRGSATGTISNLNAGASSFSLTTEKGTFQVTLQPNAVIMINNGPAAFSDLQNGMTAQVYGFIDQNLLTISAQRVAARFFKTPSLTPYNTPSNASGTSSGQGPGGNFQR